MANGILSLIQPNGSDKFNLRAESVFYFKPDTSGTNTPASGYVSFNATSQVFFFAHDNIVSIQDGMIIAFESPITTDYEDVVFICNGTKLNTTPLKITNNVDNRNGCRTFNQGEFYIMVYDGQLNFRLINTHLIESVSSSSSRPVTSKAVYDFVTEKLANRFTYVLSNSAATTPNTAKYNGSAGTLAPSANTEYTIYLVKHDHMINDIYDEWITIKNGSTYTWEKIGNTDMDISGLLANIKDHKFTPEGTVSQPTFTGTKATSTSAGGHSHKVTATGNVSSSFTGTAATLSGTTSGHTHSIAANKINVSSTYKPEGSVSGSFSGTQTTTSSVDNHTHSITVDSITSTGTYKPAGTVTAPAFTGTQATISSYLDENYELNQVDDHTHSIPALSSSGTYTPEGTVSSGFKGTAGNISVTSTAATITSSGAHTHSIAATDVSVSSTYKPTGSVSTPTVTLKNNTFNIIDSVGTTSSYTVANEVLTLTASTVPTTKPQTVSVQSVSQPKFTGDNATITSTNATEITISSSGAHTHSIPALNSTGTFTPSGTVNSSFTGTSKTVSVSSAANTTGSGGAHTHKIDKETFIVKGSYKPAGNVSQPTFTGTLATITVKNAVATTSAAGAHSHTVTATGALSNLAFTGTSATITSTNSAAVATNSSTDSVNITYTPEGTVSSTFSGTSSTTDSVAHHTHDVTASGTVSQPTFSGVEVTLPHEQDN